jgi:hypothetical protein
MSDEVDVENSLVQLIANALYPTANYAQPSLAGVTVKVFRGWPTPQLQQQAIANSSVNVSVASRNGVERNVSRYPILAQTLAPAVHTLTTTVLNNTIVIGGTISTPQNVVVLVGQQFQTSYAVLVGDTLTSIAAAVAALINASFPGTTSSGTTITVPTGRQLIARVAGQGQIITETKRQEKSFQVTTWAPPCTDKTKDADAWRNAVINVIDPVLSAIIRIALPDNTWGHIYYERTISLELAQAEGLYRRDLFYWVEYGTTITANAFEIGTAQTQVTPAFPPDGTLKTFPSSGANTINSNT